VTLGLSILETAIYASDLDAAEGFYRDVLGLSFDSKVVGRHVFFRCGDAMLLVFNPTATAVKAGDVPVHGAHGPGHVAFAVENGEFAPCLERLAKHGVEIEASVDWRGGGRSIYFRDPDGNSIELTTPSIWGIGTDH
jgi:catechol 2,3-dioxygenase-like lactoylglutathione lyase family enzyme